MFNKTMNHTVSKLRIGYRAVQEKSSIGHQFLVLTLALTYGGLLASMPLDVFLDRVNYLNYAENSWHILERYWAINPLAGLANEPLWLLINAGLATVLSPEVVLRLIIFVPASLVAWNVLRQDSRQLIWLLVFLLLPQVINNHIVHLRQGAAIAVFLTGWFTTRRSLRWLMLATTPFIHAAFFFIMALLMLTGIARRLRFAAGLRTLLFIGFGLGIGGALGWLASFLNARQGDQYAFSMTDVSGFGFVFWGMVLGVMCLQGRAFMRRHAFELGVIVFYLATYFLIEVTARIFECGLLLVLMAGLRLTCWRRVVFLALITGYGVLQYALKINEPWIGLAAQ